MSSIFIPDRDRGFAVIAQEQTISVLQSSGIISTDNTIQFTQTNDGTIIEINKQDGTVRSKGWLSTGWNAPTYTGDYGFASFGRPHTLSGFTASYGVKSGSANRRIDFPIFSSDGLTMVGTPVTINNNNILFTGLSSSSGINPAGLGGIVCGSSGGGINNLGTRVHLGNTTISNRWAISGDSVGGQIHFLRNNGVGVLTSVAYIDGAGNYTTISDETVKYDIQPMSNVLTCVCAMASLCKSYKVIGADITQTYRGFISQELEQSPSPLIRSLVQPVEETYNHDQTDPDQAPQQPTITNRKFIKYQELIPILVKAIKELTDRIIALEAR